MCFHKWTKWEIIEDGNITHNHLVIGSVILQQKRCIKCNKVKRETIRSYYT